MKNKNPRLSRKKPIPQRIVLFVEHSTSIAKRIDAILKKQGRDLKWLAKATNESVEEVHEWMSGCRDFTLKRISTIEAVLGEPIIDVKILYPPKKKTELKEGDKYEFINKDYRVGYNEAIDDFKKLN